MERKVSENAEHYREVNRMVKEITVLSGKGGTGKTSLTASLAVLSQRTILTDCDVDAPDLHMLLKPEVLETQEFKASRVAVIDDEICIQCAINVGIRVRLYARWHHICYGICLCPSLPFPRQSRYYLFISIAQR